MTDHSTVPMSSGDAFDYLAALDEVHDATENEEHASTLRSVMRGLRNHARATTPTETPTGQAEGGDGGLAALRLAVDAWLDEFMDEERRTALVQVCDWIDRRLATPAAPGAATGIPDAAPHTFGPPPHCRTCGENGHTEDEHPRSAATPAAPGGHGPQAGELGEIDRRADAESPGRTRDSAPSVLTLSTEDGQIVATVEQPEGDDVVAAARRALDDAGMPCGWYGLATAYGPTNPDHIDYVPAWLATPAPTAATEGEEEDPRVDVLARRLCVEVEGGRDEARAMLARLDALAASPRPETEGGAGSPAASGDVERAPGGTHTPNYGPYLRCPPCEAAFAYTLPRPDPSVRAAMPRKWRRCTTCGDEWRTRSTVAAGETDGGGEDGDPSLTEAADCVQRHVLYGGTVDVDWWRASCRVLVAHARATGARDAAAAPRVASETAESEAAAGELAEDDRRVSAVLNVLRQSVNSAIGATGLVAERRAPQTTALRRVAAACVNVIDRESAPPAPEVVTGEQAAALPVGSVVRCVDYDGTPEAEQVGHLVRIEGAWRRRDGGLVPRPTSTSNYAVLYRPAPTPPTDGGALAVGETVVSVEQLDALPVGTVIASTKPWNRVARRESSDLLARLWSVTGFEHGLAAPEDVALLPARVLDLPASGQNTGGEG